MVQHRTSGLNDQDALMRPRRTLRGFFFAELCKGSPAEDFWFSLNQGKVEGERDPCPAARQKRRVGTGAWSGWSHTSGCGQNSLGVCNFGWRMCRNEGRPLCVPGQHSSWASGDCGIWRLDRKALDWLERGRGQAFRRVPGALEENTAAGLGEGQRGRRQGAPPPSQTQESLAWLCPQREP